MQSITCTFSGISPILLNNPQTVDPFNRYAKAMKTITAKRKKSDDDLLELRRLEVEAKCYFDERIGIYVPSTWVVAAIGSVSWTKGKVKRADIRSSVFPTAAKLPLHFAGREKIKALSDVSGNPEFQRVLLLKQGQVKVAKAAPIFHDWQFSVELEFDHTVLNERELTSLIEHASRYGGFGDFRPTYGACEVSFG